jgi:hypothetical protein
MNIGILTEGAFGVFLGTTLSHHLPILTEGAFSPFVVVITAVDFGIIIDGIQTKYIDNVFKGFIDKERR